MYKGEYGTVSHQTRSSPVSCAMSSDHFLLHGRHIPVLIVLQIAFIILFGFFVEYADEVDSAKAAKANTTTNEANSIGHYYPSKLTY